MTAPEPRSSGAAPWLAFATCCSVWGSTFLFIRIANDTVPPVWGAAVRLALAAVMFALLTLVFGSLAVTAHDGHSENTRHAEAAAAAH